MSLVVAYKKDGVVYMGADTQSSSGSNIDRTLNESGFKISRLSNGMLLGVCGRVRGHQKMLRQKKLFDVPDGASFDKRYIVKNIIPELSKLVKGENDNNDSCNSALSVSVLLGYKDRLFLISKYLEVYECEHCVAIGAGDDFSMYELSMIGRDKDVEEGLLRALRAGAHFDSTVSAPFILINTRDQEYKIVEV